MSEERDLRLRRIVHELSNIMTGMLIFAGLLSDALQTDPRHRYALEIYEAGERSTSLLREARALLGDASENPDPQK